MVPIKARTKITAMYLPWAANQSSLSGILNLRRVSNGGRGVRGCWTAARVSLFAGESPVSVADDGSAASSLGVVHSSIGRESENFIGSGETGDEAGRAVGSAGCEIEAGSGGGGALGGSSATAGSTIGDSTVGRDAAGSRSIVGA